MLLSCLLACIVSSEKPAVTILFVLSYLVGLLSLASFKSFLNSSGSKQFYCYVLWCRFFLSLMLGVNCVPWICRCIVFTIFWKILVIISLNIFCFLFPLVTPVTCILGCIKLSHKSLLLYLFFLLIFLYLFGLFLLLCLRFVSILFYNS